MALSPYHQRVVDDGAYLYFSMGQSSGSINDSVRGLSMGGSGGRFYSQPSEVGLNYAIRLSNGYFTTLSEHFSYPPSPSSNEFAFEFWAKMSSLPSGIHRIMHRNGCFSISTIGNNLELVIRDAFDNTFGLTTNISTHDDNQFRHYFYNYDGATIKLYVDGVMVDTDTVATVVGWDDGKRFCLGTGVNTSTNAPTTQYWNGTIDAFAFYKTYLSLEDIQDHYVLGTEPTREVSSGLDTDFGFRGQLGTRDVAMEGASSIGFDPALDLAKTVVNRGQAWWDYDYPFRRRLQYQAPPNGIEKDHPAYLTLPRDIIKQQKALPDLSNLFMLYLESELPQVWVTLPSYITTTDTSIDVSFSLAKDMAASEISIGRYFLYYGDKSGIINVDTLEDPLDEWFHTLYPDSLDVDYTRPGVDWDDGKAHNVGAKMTVTVYGDRIRLWSLTGPDKGIAEVQINDRPWQQIDLYAPVAAEAAVMTVRELLPTGNILRFRATGQNNPASLGNEVNFTKVDYGKYSTFTDIKEEADESKNWGSTLGGMIDGRA